MLSEYVSDIFHSHIDAAMRCIDANSESIAAASELMVGCMLSEGKIFCCGDGANSLMPHLLTANLQNRYQYERPSLPAINLSADTVVTAGITADSAYGELYSRQLQSLGQSGDIVVIYYQGNVSAAVVKAVQAAHERDMTIIAISNADGSETNALLTANDIEIAIPHNNRARVSEMQMVVTNSLCELVEMQLFGANE
ncbi:D-sedoheptulose 7-phosphate isomerase [Litorivivens lipolytica]|uniref:D-sedoheptulose 7-phosphate isomerase n=1 Tax=Litorivivens lipolytica TaxID=1524264 RepID=A0A7W4Z6M2_9GAMM|nr:SIS domain-containing protein [Litorivivens lipolytica]MBB3047090.1 D-sedoheptulose 7-phosphate isomerase [Litorivivens lipolytica]